MTTQQRELGLDRDGKEVRVNKTRYKITKKDDNELKSEMIYLVFLLGFVGLISAIRILSS